MSQIDIRYRVRGIAQVNSKCCWLACYKMLYDWKGKKASAVTPKIQKAGISTTKGLVPKDWYKARNALGLSSISYSHLKTASGMRWCLSKCGPIWCAGDFLNNGPHAILVTGIYSKDTMLQIHDPYILATRGEVDSMGHGLWCKLIFHKAFACQLWW